MKKNKSGIKKNIAGGSNMRRARQGAVVPMMKGGVVKLAGGGMGKSGVKKMAGGGKSGVKKMAKGKKSGVKKMGRGGKLKK
jgi:hypothetical protein